MTSNTRRAPWPALLAAVALGSLAVSSAGISQSPASQTPLIRSRVEMVNLLFTVVDKKDRLVGALTRNDFDVYEDGVAQKIEFFSFAGEIESPPLTIVFLLDTSGSLKPKMSQAIETASEFFESVLRPNKDIAALIQFDSSVTLIQDFTADVKRLQAALNSVRAGGSTALFDAVYLGIREKLTNETGRRVLVILSDGDDTSSKTTEKEAINAAQKSDVVIYSIGIRDREFPANFGALKDISRATGGEFFNPTKKLADLQQAFSTINNNIKNQYNISYRSTNQARDGAFRQIRIRVKKDGLKARHRAGYYASTVTTEE